MPSQDDFVPEQFNIPSQPRRVGGRVPVHTRPTSGR